MTELQLENNLIRELKKQNYEHRTDIKDENTLNQNFKRHLELRNSKELNGKSLTQGEFKRFLSDIITGDVYSASTILRDKVQFQRDDNTVVYLSLFNMKEWCANDFEVINQFILPHSENSENTKNDRYDVIILINGLPLVHIELKRDKISPKNALAQIIKYKDNHSGGLGRSLFCFTQIYIMATESLSYYCVNNNINEFRRNQESQFIPVFEWADEHNKKMNHLLEEFVPSFLNRCFISKMIAKYIVQIQVDRKLMILRPYQVHATESVISHLKESSKNGYIWHTTGSGKTLTSFKCATILRDEFDKQGNPLFDKILFVVDRKDLDKQTVDEFRRYEEDCVDKTQNTKELIKRLEDDSLKSKVIVTTLQKLTRVLEQKPPVLDLIKDKNVVFIFDECHRSQFGTSNELIRSTFSKCRMIGFTGTPIKEKNAPSKKFVDKNNVGDTYTTDKIFDQALHHYLIGDAIEDKNVLSFNVNYYKDIDTGSELTKRKAVVQEIINKYNDATQNRKFNAIFAVSSISTAIEYYKLFKEQNTDLAITAIFSPPPSVSSNYTEDCPDEDYTEESQYKSDALVQIMNDYNDRYKTAFTMNTFDGYYDDVSVRIKKHHVLRQDKKASQQLHLLIVVDMFLTGFDSPYTNSLFVDKNLKYHSLIQAFSRTNRTVDNTKPHGNIYCFTDLSDNVRDAIMLFSHDNEKQSTIWLATSYAAVKQQIIDHTQALNNLFYLAGLPAQASSVTKLDPQQKREYFAIFRELQKAYNAITQYASFTPEERQEIETKVIPKDAVDSYRAQYLEFRDKPTSREQELGNPYLPVDDLGEDLMLEFSHNELIDWDYIMMLIGQNIIKTGKKVKYTKDDILELLRSDERFRTKTKLVQDFFEYAQENDYFKGVTEYQVQQALLKFSLEKEEQAWQALREEMQLDAVKLQAFRKEYDNYGKFDESLLKASYVQKIDFLQKTIEYKKLVQKARQIISDYSVKFEGK